MQVADTRSGGELVRVLGIIFGLAAVVGGSEGQGILRTPGIVAAAVPDARIILLLWMWISSMAVLLGAEINAIIEHRSPDGKRASARSMDDRGEDLSKSAKPEDASRGGAEAASGARA